MGQAAVMSCPRTRVLTTLLLAAGIAGLGEAQQLEPYRMQAVFAHSGSNLPYISFWQGSLDLDLHPDPGGKAELGLFLGLGEQPCDLATTWLAIANEAGSATAPVTLCLAAASATERSFNTWIRGTGKEDPTLQVRLEPVPGGGSRWRNVEPVSAQIFIRGCARPSPRFLRYGELQIEPSALELFDFSDPKDLPRKGFFIREARIDEIDPLVWQELTAECGNSEVMLPAVAVSGKSTGFVGTSPAGSTLEDLPTRPTRAIETVLDSLMSAGELSRPAGSLVTRLLDDALVRMELGRPLQASRSLQRFESRVTGLGSRGGIGSEQAKELLAGTALVQDLISRTAFAAPGVVLESVFCGKPTPCEPQTFHVRSPLFSEPIGDMPDGSPERPFPTLGAALDRAAAVSACSVRLIVQPGLFTENITITRDTAILGQGSGSSRPILLGSVLSRGPHRLEISRLTMGASGPPAAILVEHACAATVLDDVTISGASRYAIRQRGGSLHVRASRLTGTRATEDEVTAGTAIHLSGNTRAVLINLQLDFNQGGALFAEGPGTRVYATGMDVNQTSFNRFFLDEIEGSFVPDGIAAVEIGDRALLLMQWSRIRDSELVGLLVRDEAQAHFRFGIAQDTRDVRVSPTRDLAGRNFFALNGALLHLSSFFSDRSTAGMVIQHSLARGQGGALRSNEIGLAYPDVHPDFQFACAVEGLRFIDNGRNVDGRIVPLPEVVLPTVDGDPPEPVDLDEICPEVAWNCSWCTP